MSQHPENADNLAVLKKGMWDHFQYEEQRFSAVHQYNSVDHKMKHYKFWVILDDPEPGSTNGYRNSLWFESILVLICVLKIGFS